MEKYKPIRQLMAAGEFRKALDHISRILQKNPDDWDAKLLYGTCRMMQGDTETAKLIHQQGEKYFESGKDIPAEQKSFWDKYKKLIFYGLVGTALVLVGVASCGKAIERYCEVITTPVVKYGGPPMPTYIQNTKYAGPPMVDHHKYDGPVMPRMKQEQIDVSVW